MFLTFGLLLLLCTENVQVTGQDLPTVLPQTTNSSACDVPGALRCFSGINIIAQPLIQVFDRGDVSNISVGDLQRICMYLQEAYYCIETKLDVCPMAIHLWRDMVLSGSRFICNDASQDFIDSLGCLYRISKANTTMKCASQIDMTEWSKYFTGQKSLVDNKEEFCGVASKWSACYMESVRSVCNARENDFVYRMMTQLTTPIKTYIQCDVMAVQELPTVLPQTTTSTECDASWALKCFYERNFTAIPLSHKYARFARFARFRDFSNYSLQDVEMACRPLLDVYDCIGTKLDGCEWGLRLLMDILVSISRFICNNADEVFRFMNSAGCFYKVDQANTTINCRWDGYMVWAKRFVDNDNEICGMVTEWTACQLEAARSVCNARENDFLHRYMTQLTTPIKKYTQCDVMAVVGQVATAPSATVSVHGCDKNGAILCMAQNNAMSQMLGIFGSAGNTNLTADELQNICKSFEDVYLCIGSKLDGCSMEIQLLRDAIVQGSRYICYAASQEFIESIGCMNKLMKTGTLKECFNEPIGSEWNAYYSGVKNISSNYDDFCSILNNLTSCYMNSVSSLCTTRDYNFFYNVAPNTTVSINDCDINGARMCMAPINRSNPMLSIFSSAGYTNLTAQGLQRSCKLFENVYMCVGSKLDGCSMYIRLIRDGIIRSSRYICYSASQEFINSLGCMKKLLETAAIGECVNGHIGTQWNAYFGGVKKISSNYDDFCSILNNFTSCYMNSVSTLCTTRDYNFIYKYLKEMSAPLTQCTILQRPTTPGATTSFPVTTAKWKPRHCYYRGVHMSAKLRRKMDKWCRQNCKRGYCPRSICRCERKSTSSCFAIGIFRKVPAAGYWCIENCQRGNCPRDRCRCKRRF